MKSILIGNPSFENLITNDYIYVDKTDILYNLIKLKGTYFFCSRPRRFGKTLTISTLEAIFQGKRELFKGLKIYGMDYDWKEYPIIHLDLAMINPSTPKALETQLNEKLFAIAEQYGVSFKHSKYCNANLGNLIIALSQKGKVVVLIDEYDKILSSNIYNPNVEEMRGVLRGFFEVIKAQYNLIRFAFITGVTKFAKVSIFSSMNNLNDISMDKEYASLFGYTDEEIGSYFGEYIDKGITATGMSQDEYIAALRKKYDGYRFSPYSEIAVYNPVSIGLFFSKGGENFNNYWIETGGMMLLMNVAKKVRFDISKDVARAIDIENITTFDILAMASNDIDSAAYRSLLFQSGYLTIKGVDEDNKNLLLLDFPNEEVATAYSKNILSLYGGETAADTFSELKIDKCFADGRVGDAIDRLKSIYEAIPYDLSKHADELYYSSIFFSSMKALGALIGSEIETKNGRADAILKAEKHIYIFEFKHDQSADIALKQIHDKGYANQFASDSSKTVHLVGINFSSSEKNINEWKEEIL